MAKKNKPVSRVLLTGCYGTGNCGDEAILESLIHLMREHYGNIRIYVATIDPDQTKKIHNIETTIPTIERDPITWITTLQKVDRIYIGGGSLLGDTFVIRHGIIVILAKLFNVPVCFTSVGFARAKSREEYWLRNEYLQSVDAITVRDKETKYKLGLENREHTKVVPDPVFVKDIIEKPEHINVELPEEYLLVCGRYLKSRESFNMEELAVSLDNISQETDLEIVLIPFHNSGSPSDVDFCKDLSEQLESDPLVIKSILEHREIKEIIAQSEVVVGVRLHSIILAAKNNIPVVGISYHPKCESALKLLGTDDPIWIDNISSEELTYRILNRYNDYSYKKELTDKSENLDEKSSELFNVIEEMIQSGTTNRIRLIRLIPLYILGLFRYFSRKVNNNLYKNNNP